MPSIKHYIEETLNSFLARYGRQVVRKAILKNYEAKACEYVEQIEGALTHIGLIHLSHRQGRQERLAHLIGTSVCEGLYICEHLNRAVAVTGDICEFGVAQGATSALLANEILDTDRSLWLYDSFEGLPAPTERDVLIDDIFNLGSIDRYQGTMRSPVTDVRAHCRRTP